MRFSDSRIQPRSLEWGTLTGLQGGRLLIGLGVGGTRSGDGRNCAGGGANGRSRAAQTYGGGDGCVGVEEKAQSGVGGNLGSGGTHAISGEARTSGGERGFSNCSRRRNGGGCYKAKDRGQLGTLGRGNY